MALESATHITDLVATNPTGTDAPAQGDDHVRMLKSVLLTDFPNINSPVTATPAQLNQAPLTPGTPVNATGTAVDFNSIPSGTRRIQVLFWAVSTNGSSQLLLQIGDSGGIEATSYGGTGASVGNAVATAAGTYGAGFGIPSAAAGNSLYGIVTLARVSAATNLWVASGVLAVENSATVYLVGGGHALSAELDRVRITTVNGTDTFDAGSFNILVD